MKHSIVVAIVFLLVMSTAACSLAENPGRGGNRGNGSMQTLNQGIAYMNGDDVEQDYQKALELFRSAYDAGSMKAARYCKSKGMDWGTMIPAFLEAVSDCLVAEGKVQLPGFGTFEVRDRAARTGRNPQTGETLEVPACKVVGFKAGKSLREAINQ